jgi:hypothetical protein
MFTLVWLKDAAERAIKSFAQAILLAITASAGFDLFHANLLNLLSLGAGGFVLSVLTSVVSVGVGNSGTASLTNAVEPATDAVP